MHTERRETFENAPPRDTTGASYLRRNINQPPIDSLCYLRLQLIRYFLHTLAAGERTWNSFSSRGHQSAGAPPPGRKCKYPSLREFKPALITRMRAFPAFMAYESIPPSRPLSIFLPAPWPTRRPKAIKRELQPLCGTSSCFVYITINSRCFHFSDSKARLKQYLGVTTGLTIRPGRMSQSRFYFYIFHDQRTRGHPLCSWSSWGCRVYHCFW